MSQTGNSTSQRKVEPIVAKIDKRIGQKDANWPDWYAAYMVAEASGAELPK
jgi:hypothetical protein